MPLSRELRLCLPEQALGDSRRTGAGTPGCWVSWPGLRGGRGQGPSPQSRCVRLREWALSWWTLRPSRVLQGSTHAVSPTQPPGGRRHCPAAHFHP